MLALKSSRSLSCHFDGKTVCWETREDVHAVQIFLHDVKNGSLTMAPQKLAEIHPYLHKTEAMIAPTFNSN
jgi:hypothetical protein